MNWLHSHVQGLSDRREARKYATAMLHAGLIRHTVNKTTFSEQCYYTLGELTTNTAGTLTPTHLHYTLPAFHSIHTVIVELELILVLILGHIQSTVDLLGDGLFLSICTGPTLPIIRVNSMSPLMLASYYQCGWLLYVLNLIST